MHDAENELGGSILIGGIGCTDVVFTHNRNTL